MFLSSMGQPPFYPENNEEEIKEDKEKNENKEKNKSGKLQEKDSIDYGKKNDNNNKNNYLIFKNILLNGIFNIKFFF